MFTMALGFDIFSAIILFLTLPLKKKQWLQIFMSTLLIVFILRNSRVLSYIFAGL